ncbi:aminopeptidase [Thiohalorhabdus denitrificans]|uniref:M18 family aminopeptidase n=1 Tax=Thiohalorhabdus denitrificans TaxID=381306 RepID=A0A0P9GMD0_9GAMM|nr:M18 family aminopeptidase [Thiohalorhabdus denitrificans]KPV41521.1 aminopeptidase [Thiohalorhabdus denitrificans]SCY30441.1 aspartyl aminopeptidase [Thiohalorhabdus denitrificans]
MNEQDRRQTAQDLLDYIDASPSPWHAVANAMEALERRGYQRLWEEETWDLLPGRAYYVVRDDSSLIAFRIGNAALEDAGFRIVGAHTDSPGFRVKPNAAFAKGPLAVLGTEIYGGPILATFTDRDLTLAGRVFVRDKDAETGVSPVLVNFARPLLRLPNLAIHMNREVNKEGLKLDYQEQLPLFLSALSEELPPERQFRRLLAEQAGVKEEDLVSWGLAVADTQPGAFWGPDNEFLADSQVDNLASCHAALAALPEETADAGVAVAALFDHEEVGSESYKGAAGNFLESVLARIAEELELSEGGYRSALARSWLLSADMAHATHPHYPGHHEPQHPVKVNEGPVIKINAAQRYATDELGEAFFVHLCEASGVPHQRYIHRNDLPCGSTIGPMMAARLGLRTVDVGNPMWAMHSLRESAGALDHGALIRVLETFYTTGQGGVGGSLDILP